MDHQNSRNASSRNRPTKMPDDRTRAKRSAVITLEGWTAPMARFSISFSRSDEEVRRWTLKSELDGLFEVGAWATQVYAVISDRNGLKPLFFRLGWSSTNNANRRSRRSDHRARVGVRKERPAGSWNRPQSNSLLWNYSRQNRLTRFVSAFLDCLSIIQCNSNFLIWLTWLNRLS